MFTILNKDFKKSNYTVFFFLLYNVVNMDIREQIINLKKEKNAVILAHCYQNSEIDEVADFVGDSLYLSQQAANSNADIIVFAGVTFMAQTAKIISPDKKVLIPTLDCGCDMADMINLNQLREFKSKYPNIPVVCYINSTAEVKSECDICCTSSNAVKIVESLNSDKVLFLPDQYLGKWVEAQLSGVEVITYNGCCPIHNKVSANDVKVAKSLHPNAKVLTHPECKSEVTLISDYVGSTTGIMKYVANNPQEDEFIIVTEKGVVDRLRRDYAGKKFYLIKEDMICPSMKTNRLEDILKALTDEKYEVTLDSEISQKALGCIERMLQVSQ